MPAPLQSVSKTSSTLSAVTPAFGSGLTSGTKLVAYLQMVNSTTPSTVQDSNGNSFTQILSYTVNTTSHTYIYVLDTPAGDVGAKPTVTLTCTGTANGIAILVQEVPGLAAGSTAGACLDGSAGLANGNVTTNFTWSFGAYTSALANEYLVAILGDTGDGSGSTNTTPPGYTADTSNISSDSNEDLRVYYKNSTGAAETVTNETVTIAGTASWCTILVAFKLAPATATSGWTLPGRPVRRRSKYRRRVAPSIVPTPITPISLWFNAEGGTSGNPVAATDTGDNTEFDVVGIGTSATFNRDNTQSANGSQSVQIATTATAANAYGRWSTQFGTQSEIWTSIYLKSTTGTLGASVPVVMPRIVNDTGSVAIRIHTDGTVRIFDGNNSNIAGTATTIPSGSWCRIDAHFIAGASNAFCEVRLFLTPSSTVWDDSASAGSLAGGGAPFTGIRFGITGGNQASVGPFWIDDFRVGNTGWFVPLTPATSAAGNLDISGTASGSADVGSPSGSLAISGSATAAAPVSATGSISLTGTGPPGEFIPPTVSGSLSLSGTATAVGQAVASGSLALSGTATAAGLAIASGSLALSGTAAAAGLVSSASGSLALSGSSAASAKAVASGSLTLAGAATASANATASGSLALSGTAVAVGQAAASGSLAISGSATAAANVTASGSVSLSGTAAWIIPPTVPGSLSISGTATAKAAATASGSLALSGTATAVANASASGSISLNGTAAWVIAAVSGSLSISGTATAKAAATASGSLSINGTAIGPGTYAVGALSITGTASAAAPATASGSLSLSGTAMARAAAIASGAIAIAGTAAAVAKATASGSLAINGTATGPGASAAGSLSLTGANVTAQAVAVASGSFSIAGVSAAKAVAIASGSLSVTGVSLAGARVTAISVSLSVNGAAFAVAPVSATGGISFAGTAAAFVTVASDALNATVSVDYLGSSVITDGLSASTITDTLSANIFTDALSAGVQTDELSAEVIGV